MSSFKIFLIFSLSAIFILLIFIALRPAIQQNNSPQPTQGISKVEEVATKCTRTEMLKNKPEFERALSLIKQRSTHLAGGFNDVINCTVVIYKDIKNTSGAEGYFLFDDSVASANYLPIYVDTSYKEADDVVTSMLLVHEMAHAEQFLNKLQGHDISCVDKEVNAFITQFYYSVGLNKGEFESLGSRWITNSAQPQIQGFGTLVDINADSLKSCGYTGGYDQCWFNAFKGRVTSMVTSNPFYREECKI